MKGIFNSAPQVARRESGLEGRNITSQLDGSKGMVISIHCDEKESTDMVAGRGAARRAGSSGLECAFAHIG